MNSFSGKDVNEVLPDLLWDARVSSIVEGSRNGRVRSFSDPVCTEIQFPQHRVMFCKDRKENPFFHLMECLWMMAGESRAEWLLQFNPRFKEYAEADGHLHGAYGHRWRFHFGREQLISACNMIKKDPTTRRVVIGMWDPSKDLNADKKDLPCNTHLYLRVVKGRLNMTVCNRSNDLIWGMMGSNVVHFSFLLEWLAHECGLEVGSLYQFTNNLHIYQHHWQFLEEPPIFETYSKLRVTNYPVKSVGRDEWMDDCHRFIAPGWDRKEKYTEPFFKDVALPVRMAWNTKKNLDKIAATDWRLACRRYIERVKKVKE